MTDRKLKEAQLIELRQLATDADGENWRALDYYDLNANRAAFMVETGGLVNTFIAGDAMEWNARYIAAADPGTVLALLDRLDALLDERSQLRSALAVTGYAASGVPMQETFEKLDGMSGA